MLFGITQSCGLREPIYLSESQSPHPCKGDNANTYWDAVSMEQMIENSHCWEQQGILDYFYQSLIGDLLGDKHSRSEFGRAREKLIKVHGSHTKGVSRLSLSAQWC